MQLRRKDVQTVEMQMGPMIDMVFLLLVFFMVTAKPIEQRIVIHLDGQVILNEQPLDSITSEELPTLIATLKRFKESADANKSEALITIQVEDGAKHQRIVNVLNACAKAKITGVTFADDSEEES